MAHETISHFFLATSLRGFVCWLGRWVISAKFYFAGEQGVYPVTNFMDMVEVGFTKESFS